MGLNPKQIGWSVTSNLLYQLERKLAHKNGNVSQEIGWSTENNLLYDGVESAPCSPCNGESPAPTTSTSTTTTSTTTTTTTTTSTTTTSTTTTTTSTTTTTTLASAWTLYGGTSSAFATAGPPAIAKLSTDVIAFGNAGGTGYLRTYQWNGTSWNQVGNALNIGYTTVLALTAISSTSVLAVINNNGVSSYQSFAQYNWDGTNWSLFGAPSVIGIRNWAALATITPTVAAYTHDGGNIVRIAPTVTPNNGTWGVTGFNQLYTFGLTFSSPRICYMGVGERIAYVSGNQLACLQHDGVNWQLIGNIFTVPGTVYAPSVAYYDVNKIAWVDAASFGAGQIRTYSFDGTNWSLLVGSTSYTEAGIAMIANFEPSRYVVGNNGTNNLINYQYS